MEGAITILSATLLEASADKPDAAYLNREHETNSLQPTLMIPVCDIEQLSPGTPLHDHMTLGDILISPAASSQEIQSAIEAVMQSCNAKRMDFHNIPDSSALVRLLGGEDNSPGSKTEWSEVPVRETAWFDLAAEEAIPSGKLKRNIKRLRRKLEECGTVNTHYLTHEQAIEAFESFLETESSGWKGDQGSSTAIRNNPVHQLFYRTLLEPEYPGLTPIIHQLSVDEKIIAVQFALATENTLYILKIGYDEHWAEYSPGSLLLDALLQSACSNGFSRVSLVSNPAWANRWHPQTETVWRLTKHRSSLEALGVKTLTSLKRQIRKSTQPH